MSEAAGVTIRSAREDELDRVAEIIVAAFGQYAAQMSPDAWSSFAVDIANVRGRMSDADILVAERDGGDIVGTISHYAHWRGAQADTSALRLLAVEPDEQGEGVGRALMEHCINGARQAGKERIAFTSIDEMQYMRALAEKLGFVRDPNLDHEPAPGVRARGYYLKLGEE